MEYKFLSKHYHKSEYQSLKGYETLGGYLSLKKSVKSEA